MAGAPLKLVVSVEDNVYFRWQLAILYESLAGKRPFEGETASDTLAKILESEPDLKPLAENAPSNIRRLLRR